MRKASQGGRCSEAHCCSLVTTLGLALALLIAQNDFSYQLSLCSGISAFSGRPVVAGDSTAALCRVLIGAQGSLSKIICHLKTCRQEKRMI